MKLKVCGMKENPVAVADLNPDYLGFIFWEPSSRYVAEPSQDLTRYIKRVGVFVDSSILEILNQIETFDLSLVQLHGKESPEFCADLRKELSSSSGTKNANVELIKVFSVNDDFDFSILTD